MGKVENPFRDESPEGQKLRALRLRHAIQHDVQYPDMLIDFGEQIRQMKQTTEANTSPVELSHDVQKRLDVVKENFYPTIHGAHDVLDKFDPNSNVAEFIKGEVEKGKINEENV